MNGILDATVVTGRTASCPSGYIKIGEDLNTGAGGDFIWLCAKQGTINPSVAGLTDMTVIDGSGSACPTGYEKINVDLNKGAGGNTLYFCKKREAGVPIIRNLAITTGGKSTSVVGPVGYERVNVDLNKGSGGNFIYLWKQMSTNADLCNSANGLAYAQCRAQCVANPGSCDAFATTYCNTHPDDVFCGCMNSKLNDPKYGINPKCVDSKCLRSGTYLSSAINSTNCPSIVNCDVQNNINNSGVMIATSIPLQQNCSGGGSGGGTGGGGGTTNGGNTNNTGSMSMGELLSQRIPVGSIELPLYAIILIIVTLFAVIIGLIVALMSDDDSVADSSSSQEPGWFDGLFDD